MPSGNMTRVLGPIPATLGGSCRGEPADGMMVDSAPRNREPAVSMSSDWFSLLHCQSAHTDRQEDKDVVTEDEK